jgi:hypothetical protein
MTFRFTEEDAHAYWGADTREFVDLWYWTIIRMMTDLKLIKEASTDMTDIEIFTRLMKYRPPRKQHEQH